MRRKPKNWEWEFDKTDKKAKKFSKNTEKLLLITKTTTNREVHSKIWKSENRYRQKNIFISLTVNFLFQYFIFQMFHSVCKIFVFCWNEYSRKSFQFKLNLHRNIESGHRAFSVCQTFTDDSVCSLKAFSIRILEDMRRSPSFSIPVHICVFLECRVISLSMCSKLFFVY